MQICKVAVNYPSIQKPTLDYLDPDSKYQKGDLVWVPLGRRKTTGLVVEVSEKLETKFKLREIVELDDYPFPIPSSLKNLIQWAGNYYSYPVGKLLYEILPKKMKRPRELKFDCGSNEEIVLNQPQKEIYEKISSFPTEEFQSFYIKGITGSGKTFLYMKIALDLLLKGKSVLYLVPEINLTPHLVSKIQASIPYPVFSYHSEISAGQKWNLWKELGSFDQPFLLVGVRSATWVPVKNLGLIIVDEEHDSSFKQGDRCMYHARDVALQRGRTEKVKVVLGSATPTLKLLLKKEKFDGFFELNQRFSDLPLPKIEIIPKESKDQSILSLESIAVIEKALEKSEQVVIFINKLGYSSHLKCSGCYYVFSCPNCEIPLRYFKKKGLIKCHYCDYKRPKPTQCPDCSCLTMMGQGVGTEKIAEFVGGKFPGSRVTRFDRDEIKNLKEAQQVLEKLEKGEIDIVIGTQMVSKGHNFPGVNTVLILGIDSYFYHPDYRSEERIWQTIHQVAGRAGRFTGKGNVYIETAFSEMPILEEICEGEDSEFFEREDEIRRECEYPPYSRMAVLYFTGKSENIVSKHIEMSVSSIFLQINQKKLFNNWSYSPSSPNFIPKKKNQVTWNILLKSQSASDLHRILFLFKKNYKALSGVQFKIDIDPESFF